MVHSPLHGLNVVQPDVSPDQYADSQDPLLANGHFPDLAAQLDLWSNLTFQTDEPLIDRSARKFSAEEDFTNSLGGDDDKEDEVDAEGPASLEGHVNAVNPTAVSNMSVQHHQQHQQQQPYDMGSILAGFGIDPYMVPQVPPAQPPQAATLAQLLAAYPFAHPPFLPPGQGLPTVAPASLSTSAPGSTPANQPTTAPSKRSRTRKTSIATAVSSPIDDDVEGDDGSSTVGLSPSEDKRRRNTAASARFRMKKKEREAALEKRAQELETRVNALERECEGLRRENGWLKGLVVGVTGASQGAQVVQSPSPNQVSGTKRKRMSDEGIDVKKVAPIA